MPGRRMQRRPHSSVGSGASRHLSSRDRLAAIVHFDMPVPIRISHGGCLSGIDRLYLQRQAEPGLIRLDLA